MSILLFAMGILAIGIKTHGARLFGLLMLAIALWCFGTGGQMMSLTAQEGLRWVQIQMLGVVLVPPLWFLFTVAFSNRTHILRWWTYVLLFANAVIVSVLLMVPAWRGVFVKELIYTEVNGYLVITEWILGPYFFVHLAWLFVIVVLGDIMILRHALQWPKQSRQKLVLVILATLFPLFTNLAMVFNFFPNIHGNIDVFGFSVAGIILGVVFYLDKILEIQPVATRQLMDDISDALLVFNTNHELTQSNPIAKKLFGDPIAPDVKSHFLDLLKGLKEDDERAFIHSRLVLPRDGEDMHFDVKISSLIAMNRLVGYSVLLRDVSALIHSMEQLEQLAVTDPLTGLHNRRYFHVEGERMMEQALRYAHPICVMTFDVDHFKEINDQFGHPVGDEVLKHIAAQIRVSTRKTDIAARFGGDEFVFLLPESSTQFALSLSKRLQNLFRNKPFAMGGSEFRLTASFGIACFVPETGQTVPTLDELVRYADQKLYEAKQAGRNQISY